MDWEDHLEKNPIQKIEKLLKIKMKLPHVNKKPLAIKQIFAQTPFSHYILSLERKNFTPRRDQSHYINLTSKIMKMCEQILKNKDSAPIKLKSLNCKK